jgi:trimeric autotransporter adhesin
VIDPTPSNRTSEDAGRARSPGSWRGKASGARLGIGILLCTVLSAFTLCAVAPVALAGPRPVAAGNGEASSSLAVAHSSSSPTLLDGYLMAASDGGTFAFGDTKYYGSVPGVGDHVSNIVGMIPTADDHGYWMVGSDGGLFAFGDTHYYGSIPSIGERVSNIVGMDPTTDGHGYLIVSNQGGLFAFGDAKYRGSVPGDGLQVTDIVGVASTIDGLGYWMVARSGAVYNFGDAPYYGGVPNLGFDVMNIKAIEPTFDGRGYWIVSSNGTVYTFGDAKSYGDLTEPGVGVHVSNVVGLAPTLDGHGYWLLSDDGGVYAFGDATFHGSLPELHVSVSDVIAMDSMTATIPVPVGSHLQLAGGTSAALPAVDSTYVAQPELVGGGLNELIPRGSVGWYSNSPTISVTSGVVRADSSPGAATLTASLAGAAPVDLDAVVGPPTPPGEPTITSVTPGDGALTVGFTSPFTGGTPITSYTVSCNGKAASGSASPIRVTGLTNGVLQNCTVFASNSAGRGSLSATRAGTPVGVPFAPTITSVTDGIDGQSLVVAFSQPSDDGGAPITSYTATCGAESASGSSPITVEGLTDATPVPCTVYATNAVGNGAPSAPPVSGTPEPVAPQAPTDVTATPGNATASVAFTPPANDGGSTISSYTVTADDSTTPANGGETASGATSAISVSGLTNGDSYTFTVTATNGVGTSAASAASNAVVPLSVPGPPTNVIATAGNASASVAFTPPANTGGSTISSYTVTADDATTPANGGQTGTGASSPITVSGLMNGDTYTFTVTATSSVGTGLASLPSNAVVPATVPGAPTAVGVNNGDDGVSLMVTFTSPTSDGGSGINSYTATCGSETATGPSSPITVEGLTDNVEVTCTVYATNAVGNSAPSAPPVSGTPEPVAPQAPTGVTATAGNATASVAFTPPANDGGSTISSYTVTADDSTTPANGGQTVAGASSPITVDGLTNGDSYTFTVTATNGVGTSAASAASSPVTPMTVPGIPTIDTVSNGTDGQSLVVAFTPPTSDGGSTILSYTATCGSENEIGTSSPITVEDLTEGTTVPCTVYATNAVGNGDASAATNGTPEDTAPLPPTGVTATAGDTSASVAFTATPTSENGGSAITSYTVTADDMTTPANGGEIASGGSSPILVTDLTNGDTYTFTVTATNLIGTGAASDPSNAVVAGASQPPTAVSATAGFGSATVSFTPGANGSGSPVSSYTVTAADATTPADGGETMSGPGSPIDIGGLTNGDTYTFTVTATNSLETSPASAPSNTVVPGTPDAPTITSVTNGTDGTSLVVAFTTPVEDGSPITSYTATCGSESVTEPSSPITVEGLADGVEVTCTVYATNSTGNGAPSAGVTGTPST